MKILLPKICPWCGGDSKSYSSKQIWGLYKEVRLEVAMLCVSCKNVWFIWTKPERVS
jgi:hypothetical protein